MRFNLSTFQTCRYQDKHTRLEIEANPPEVATERTIHKTPNLNINAQTALASPFRSQNERANMAIVHQVHLQANFLHYTDNNYSSSHPIVSKNTLYQKCISQTYLSSFSGSTTQKPAVDSYIGDRIPTPAIR
jgi:hypothetical protein